MVMIKMVLMVVVVVIDPLQTAVILVDNPLCRNDELNDIITLNYTSTTFVQC